MILLAGATTHVLSDWEQALDGFSGVLVVRRFDTLNETLRRLAPGVLLLDMDLPGLDGIRGVAVLRKTNPSARMVVFTNVVSDELEIALFKLGIRGCAHRGIEPRLLKRILAAIEEGELWIRRAIMPRLLDEMAARPRNESSASGGTEDPFNVLTEREREIATLIGNGESNKQITRELCITERTVKAHLTGIFRKLDVADRVRLALRVAARPEAEQVGST
jgi:DNA-binding NarL/FixJ family response regulator